MKRVSECCHLIGKLTVLFLELLYGWHIITPNKSFAVHAASLTEKKEWMAHIQKCITSLGTGDRNQVGPKDLAPVWISDDSAPFCMLCTKTKFTFLTRRVSSANQIRCWVYTVLAPLQEMWICHLRELFHQEVHAA